MSTPNTNAQLATLRTRLGEPEDEDQGRWSPAQLLAQLNPSRNEVAEQTQCYQVKDAIAFTAATLPAAGVAFLVSLVNDFIWVKDLTWNGVPLRIVRPENWADVVGSDDTLNGDPVVAKFFGRQFQIYRVPTEAGILQYNGHAYPPELVAGGVDAAFTVRAADVAIWHAAMVLKGSDERSNTHEERMMKRGILELSAQYKARGPRFIRTGDLAAPARPFTL